MTALEVAVLIGAPPAEVWRVVSDIGSHVEWMSDAESIVFTSPQRSGRGTTFDCATRVGPLRLSDRMEVVDWEPQRLLGIRHVGRVGGTGRFVLEPASGGAGTRFRWEEELRFPWWLGGGPGAVVAAPVLRRLWRRNLDRLRSIVEGGGGS